MSNFKTVEVKAFSKTEALSQVVEQNGIQVIKDATQAWKNAGKPVTDKSLKEFCAEYLTKWTKFAQGIGCVIVVEPGVANNRERPYTITDIKNEKGKRKFKTGIVGVGDNGEILFKNFENKAKAKEAAKELYTKHDYTGNIHATYTKEVVEGEPGAFDVTYTPSASAKLGTYIVFGVEA